MREIFTHKLFVLFARCAYEIQCLYSYLENPITLFRIAHFSPVSVVGNGLVTIDQPVGKDILIHINIFGYIFLFLFFFFGTSTSSRWCASASAVGHMYLFIYAINEQMNYMGDKNVAEQ